MVCFPAEADMFKTLEPRALSVLRIIAGFTFSLHGFQKLFGAFGGLGGQGGTAAFGSLICEAARVMCS